MSYSLIQCEECGKEADTVLCERDMDHRLHEAHEDGKAEGFEEGQKSVEPRD